MNLQVLPAKPTTGNTLSRTAKALAAILAAACVGMIAPLEDARAATVSAVEFIHHGSGGSSSSFLLTTSPSEISALDAQSIPIAHWLRTMFEFKVDDAPGPGLVPVCRFSIANLGQNGPHFLTAFPEECAAVKAISAWTFEGVAFYAHLPNGFGACEAGTMPIYRAYNGGLGGPAHRLTPYWDWACAEEFGSCVREGVGRLGVAFCVPESGGVAQQRTQQMSGGTWEFSYTVDGSPKVVQLSFGDAFADYPWMTIFPSATPGPQHWPEMPYHAHTQGDVGIAGWDPVAGKMVVVLNFNTVFQFDFDGVNASSGCAYPDILEFLWVAWGRGICHPLTVRKL